MGVKIGKRFANTSLAITQSTLPKTTVELVELRASQINGCGWCSDAHTKELAAAGEPAVRINLVAMINAANRLGVIVRMQGGFYQPGMFDGIAD
nr:carboxymuconolactone decarboxylase family protein [Nocardia xishanensis]